MREFDAFGNHTETVTTKALGFLSLSKAVAVPSIQ